MKAKWMRFLSIIIRIVGPIIGAVISDVSLFKTAGSPAIAIGGLIIIGFSYFVLLDELKRKASATSTLNIGVIILILGRMFGGLEVIAWGAVISSLIAIPLDLAFKKINKPITTDELWERIKENK